MKKIAILMALAMAATASLGAINIQWDAYGLLSGVEGSSLYATQEADSILWELVYTASDSIATPKLDESTGAISYGTDAILSSRLWEKGSTDMVVTDKVVSSTPSESPLTISIDEGYIESGAAAYKNLSYTQSSGGIYAAVFQYCSNGDVYYALTELNTGINWANEMSAADEVNFSMTSDTALTKLGTITQVPEPATMSLLGLGALAMVLRRKLRK